MAVQAGLDSSAGKKYQLKIKIKSRLPGRIHVPCVLLGQGRVLGCARGCRGVCSPWAGGLSPVSAETWVCGLGTGLSCALLSGHAGQSLRTDSAGWRVRRQRVAGCFSGSDAACSAHCPADRQVPWQVS